MTCRDFEPLIALYVEGDVADLELERHLSRCADCRGLLEDLRASQAAVKDLASEAVDPALLATVRSGVLARIDGRGRVVWRWTAALAAAVALLVVLALPARKPAPPPRPTIAKAPPKSPDPVQAAAADDRPRPRPRSHVTHARKSRPGAGPPLVVKMLTDDPNIVIIWLVDQTGD